MKRLPTLFLSHGSPMLAQENEKTDAYIRVLSDLKRKLPTPKAILSIGAHFYGPYKRVDVSEHPETVYDFYGFPEELYDMEYRAPGYPGGAELIRETIPGSHYEGTVRGLDHGTWTLLMHLFPKADIPVFSISIDSRDSFEDYFKLGEKLRILRDRGILIIANGNIVHDLATADFSLGKNIPHAFARDFDRAFQEALENKDYAALLNPYELKGGSRSVPTMEHYAPAIIIMGTAYPEESAETIYEGFELGSIGRRAFGFGIMQEQNTV